MSSIKRYIDDEVEILANEYCLPWDYVMDLAISYEFDLVKTEEYLSEHYSRKETNK